MNRTDISYSSAYVRGSGGGSCVGSIGVESDLVVVAVLKFFGVGEQYGEEKVFFLKNENR